MPSDVFGTVHLNSRCRRSSQWSANFFDRTRQCPQPYVRQLFEFGGSLRAGCDGFLRLWRCPRLRVRRQYECYPVAGSSALRRLRDTVARLFVPDFVRSLFSNFGRLARRNTSDIGMPLGVRRQRGNNDKAAIMGQDQRQCKAWKFLPR